MSTQTEGLKVIVVQARGEVIWLIDKRLYSKDVRNSTEFNVRILDKMTDPSPIIGEILPLPVDIIDC